MQYPSGRGCGDGRAASGQSAPPRARARTCPAALRPERAGDARRRREPSGASAAGAAKLARSGGGRGTRLAPGAAGLETCAASPPQASRLPGPAPGAPPHAVPPTALAPRLKAPPCGLARRPAAAVHLPAPRPTPRPGVGRARPGSRFREFLGPSQGRKRCPRREGNGEKTGDLRHVAPTPPAAPASPPSAATAPGAGPPREGPQPALPTRSGFS